MTLTRPCVAFITDPNGIWRSDASETNVVLPGTRTSTVPDTSATLPVTPNCGAGTGALRGVTSAR